jgi:hypothetical protein
MLYNKKEFCLEKNNNIYFKLSTSRLKAYHIKEFQEIVSKYK